MLTSRESSRAHDKRGRRQLVSSRRASFDSRANHVLGPLNCFSSMEGTLGFLLLRCHFVILRRWPFFQLTHPGQSFSSNCTIERRSEGALDKQQCA